MWLLARLMQSPATARLVDSEYITCVSFVGIAPQASRSGQDSASVFAVELLTIRTQHSF